MLTLLHLLSSVALLVWGTHIVRTGIMRVYGADLRRVLSASIQKKPTAFVAGIGVTALVQSSNATALLVISFVSQGLISLSPALVIMLGADVGTALMARVLTFDLSWLSPLLILSGVIVFLGQRKTRVGQMGRVGIGLGLIIFSAAINRHLRRAYHTGNCGPGHFLLTDRRYHSGAIDWGAVCHDQLFQPGGGIADRNSGGNRLGSAEHRAVHCYWLEPWQRHVGVNQ